MADRASLRSSLEKSERPSVESNTPFKDWLTVREAAQVVRRSLGTLKHWRAQGKGPPYRRFYRRVYYDPVALDRWIGETLGLDES